MVSAVTSLLTLACTIGESDVIGLPLFVDPETALKIGT